MTSPLNQIDPPDCNCDSCCRGSSQPFSRVGDTEQFRGLLHGELFDDTGCGGWLQLALRECPEQLAEFLVDELTAGRLLSRPVLQARVARHVLPELFAGPEER